MLEVAHPAVREPILLARRAFRSGTTSRGSLPFADLLRRTRVASVVESSFAIIAEPNRRAILASLSCK